MAQHRLLHVLGRGCATGATGPRPGSRPAHPAGRPRRRRRPVAADHLGAWMRAQPGGERVGLPIGEQVDWPVGAHVRPATVPYTCPRRSAKSSTPSVATVADLRVGQRPDQAQQGRSIHRHAELRGKPSPARPARASPIASRIRRSSTLRRPYRVVNPSTCSANVTRSHPARVTEQPPHPQPDRDRLAADAGVGQRAFVAAVHPHRHRSRNPDTPPAVTSRRPDDHARRLAVDPLDHHPGQVRQQNTTAPEVTCPA